MRWPGTGINTLCLASWIRCGMQPFLSPSGVKVQSLNSGCAVLGIFRGLLPTSHVGDVLLHGETGFDKATTPISSSHDYFQTYLYITAYSSVPWTLLWLGWWTATILIALNLSWNLFDVPIKHERHFFTCVATYMRIPATKMQEGLCWLSR